MEGINTEVAKLPTEIVTRDYMEERMGECWLFIVILDANQCYCIQLIYVKVGAVEHADFTMRDSFKVEGKYSFKWDNEWNRIRITRL